MSASSTPGNITLKLFAAEVLMDPSQAVSHATAVDVNPENAILWRLFREILPESRVGDFEFVESDAESFQYGAAPDVVSLMARCSTSIRPHRPGCWTAPGPRWPTGAYSSCRWRRQEAS